MILLYCPKMCQFLCCFKPSRFVSCYLFSQPLLVLVGFYSHEQWLCLFGSFEPWLACPTLIYGFGDDSFYAYPCRMSVQSFDRLFMSGPMHSALAVMHCLGTWPFSFSSGDVSVLMKPVDLRRILYSCPTSTATTHFSMKFHLVIMSWILSCQLYLDILKITFHRI